MGQLRFCTKSGVTDTGDLAEQFVKDRADSVPYAAFSERWIRGGWTPIYGTPVYFFLLLLGRTQFGTLVLVGRFIRAYPSAKGHFF